MISIQRTILAGVSFTLFAASFSGLAVARSGGAQIRSTGVAAKVPASGSAGGQTRLDARRTLGTPHTFRNLTIWPVYDPAARSSGSYLTLDEGLKAKVVRVQESKDGGEVNTLFITNQSDKPLYLMAGEVVLGGQQDRCLAKDLIVAAGQKRVPVTVFCVEHGRWNGRADFDSSAPTVAAGDIRLRAQEGNYYAEREAVAGFVSGHRVPARASRVALPALTPTTVAQSARVSDAQSVVWAKVAAKNAKFKTESSTGTYRNTLTLAAGKTNSGIPTYVHYLLNGLGNDPHLVGVVASVNGKPVAADIFGDPALFRKLWPKLLRSYAADAVENAPASGKTFAPVTSRQVKSFYAAATDAKTLTENRSKESATLRLESKDATTYRLMPKPMGAGGSAAAPLHETVLHK